MTARRIHVEDLASSLGAVADGCSTVVIIAAGGPQAPWETDTAWEIARLLGSGQRRVALIDLFLDQPQFVSPGGEGGEDGIVDAFEYGVSLNLVAQPYEGSSVFFIPAGSPTADPEGVLHNPRWHRLASGFAREGAVMVLYLPASSREMLALQPDLVISLDPRFAEADFLVAPTPPLASSQTPAVAEEEPPPARSTSDTSPARRTSPGRRTKDEVIWRVGPAKRLRYDLAGLTPLAIAAVIGGLIAAAVYLPERLASTNVNAAAAVTDSVTSAPDPAEPETPSPAATASATALTVSARPFTGNHPFVIQTASYSPDQISRALRMADVIERTGTNVVLAPTDLGARGRWHRVLLGPFPDRASAVAARTRLRETRTIPMGNGLIIQASYSLELHPSLDDRARAAGLDPFWLEERLLIGAYEDAEQTAFARQLLDNAGIVATIVQRVRTPE